MGAANTPEESTSVKIMAGKSNTTWQKVKWYVAGGIILLALSGIAIYVVVASCGAATQPISGLLEWLDFCGQTLWDWLELLIIPLLLAVGGTIFAYFQAKREREIAEKQRDIDRKIAEEQRDIDREIADNQRNEQRLQAYLDNMTELLLDHKLLSSQPGETVRHVARTRTLTVLHKLNSDRKATVIRFLHEAGLIKAASPPKPLEFAIVDLKNADLNGVNLYNADLQYANLSEANLRLANLQGADLSNADLSAADLLSANLSGAKLYEANLIGAYFIAVSLRGADLSKSDLREATLSGSDLSGANMSNTKLNEAVLKANLSEAILDRADLSGADLSGADLSYADLNEANLHGADLREAILTNTDLTAAKITAAQLAQAKTLDNVKLPAGITQADIQRAREN